MSAIQLVQGLCMVVSVLITSLDGSRTPKGNMGCGARLARLVNWCANSM